MSHIILISEETNSMLMTAADPTKTFRNTGEHLADGRWRIEVDDEVFARLNSHLRKGETYDDVIRRMYAAYRGGTILN